MDPCPPTFRTSLPSPSPPHPSRLSQSSCLVPWVILQNPILYHCTINSKVENCSATAPFWKILKVRRKVTPLYKTSSSVPGFSLCFEGKIFTCVLYIDSWFWSMVWPDGQETWKEHVCWKISSKKIKGIGIFTYFFRYIKKKIGVPHATM